MGWNNETEFWWKEGNQLAMEDGPTAWDQNKAAVIFRRRASTP